MRIHREDVDPQVVEKLLAEIDAACRKPNPTPQEIRARQLWQQRVNAPMARAGVRTLAWVFGSLAAGMVGGFLVSVTGDPEWAWVPIAVIGGLGTTMGIGTMVAGVIGTTDPHSDVQRVHADVLAAWLPTMELARAERAYCETLVLLSETGSHLDEPTQRDVLQRLNTLMAHNRRLVEQGNDLRTMTSADTLAELTYERDGLAGRLAGAVDPQAQDALRKSLELCEARLLHARSLAPTFERLDAQQEVLVQTLTSVQASMARSKAAAAPLTMPDVDEINQRVTEINDQSKAVEDAVQEVMAVVGAR